jgi:CysZ protein
MTVGPIVLSLVAFGLAVALFLAALDSLAATLQGWFTVPTPDAWYGWLWSGPLRVLAWLAQWILIAAFAVLVYLSFTLVGGILASPFLAGLSRRVERLRTGEVLEAGEAGFIGALWASLGVAWQEAKRAFFFLSVQVLLLGLGFVPGLQLLAFPLAFGFAALFLPLDYAGYILDRRGTPFRVRRQWVWANRIPVGVFGGTALLTFAVPGLNFLALPWLVTAATLLALEIGLPVPDRLSQLPPRPSALRR